jgi:hypothetical protein
MTWFIAKSNTLLSLNEDNSCLPGTHKELPTWLDRTENHVSHFLFSPRTSALKGWYLRALEVVTFRTSQEVPCRNCLHAVHKAEKALQPGSLPHAA